MSSSNNWVSIASAEMRAKIDPLGASHRRSPRARSVRDHPRSRPSDAVRAARALIWRNFLAPSAPTSTVPSSFTHAEILMKTLINFAALSLSVLLGLMPFAVIAVNDMDAAKSDVAHVQDRKSVV